MYHITADGKKILLSAMETSHLTNTIKYHIRNLDKARTILDGKEVSDFKMAVNGGSTTASMKRQAEQFARNFSEMIAPYILEAVIRNIDFGAEMRTAFQRDTPLALPFDDDNGREEDVDFDD